LGIALSIPSGEGIYATVKNCCRFHSVYVVAASGRPTKPANGTEQSAAKRQDDVEDLLEARTVKTLDEINQHLKQTGFTEKFPPTDTEVVSWYVMMGIGQVVTLRFPAEKLRDVNLAIEHGAWGAYRPSFIRRMITCRYGKLQNRLPTDRLRTR
jgi:hypothetical protein